jgi:phage shock protein E
VDMTRLRTTALALAATLAVSACSAATAIPETTSTVESSSGCGSSCAAPFDGSHVAVDAWAEAASGDGVVIVDVRTPEEYDFDHIPEAINIDLYSGAFEAEVGRLDPHASYAVYCHSGNRSREAIEVMASVGIASTVGLDGGIEAWAAAGHALVAG